MSLTNKNMKMFYEVSQPSNQDPSSMSYKTKMILVEEERHKEETRKQEDKASYWTKLLGEEYFKIKFMRDKAREHTNDIVKSITNTPQLYKPKT